MNSLYKSKSVSGVCDKHPQQQLRPRASFAFIMENYALLVLCSFLFISSEKKKLKELLNDSRARLLTFFFTKQFPICFNDTFFNNIIDDKFSLIFYIHTIYYNYYTLQLLIKKLECNNRELSIIYLQFFVQRREIPYGEQI